MLKLTIPEADLYAAVKHPQVARVVALSGGYPRDDACGRLATNHGMIASFSRALVEGLQHSMSDAEFNAALAKRSTRSTGFDRQGLSDGGQVLLRLGLALRMAGLARARAQGRSLSSQDPVVRRRRPEDGGIWRAQSAADACRSWSTTISRSPNPRRSSNISRTVGPMDRRFSPHEPRKRAIQRRMMREADDYLANAGTRYRDGLPRKRRANDLKQELRALGGRGERRLSDRRAFGGGPHRLSVHGALPADRRQKSGFRRGRLHRTSPFGLDGAHAGAADRQT